MRMRTNIRRRRNGGVGVNTAEPPIPFPMIMIMIQLLFQRPPATSNNDNNNNDNNKTNEMRITRTMRITTPLTFSFRSIAAVQRDFFSQGLGYGIELSFEVTPEAFRPSIFTLVCLCVCEVCGRLEWEGGDGCCCWLLDDLID